MPRMSTRMSISKTRTPEDAAQVRELAWEFVSFLRERYPEMDRDIDEYLRDQAFAFQIADPVRYFTPPAGECLLAQLGGHPVGILMLKPHSEGTCEMNRMFVRPEARSQGVGRALVSRLIECARELGYAAMVLSALDHHYEALPLYQSMGFRPYDPGAEALTNERAIHMRLEL